MVLPLALLALAATDAGAPARLLFSGDVTLGFHHEEYVDGLLDAGVPRQEALRWGVQPVAQVTRAADVFIINLECPFTLRGEKLPKNFNFRARPELVEALVHAGVDVASLANNHAMDWGVVGLEDTQATLQAAGIRHFGAGATLARARAPLLVEVKGQTVALLGYFFLGTRNIEPPGVIATATSPGVAGHFSDVAELKAMLREDIQSARRRADHVIPFFHWGREGKREPEDYQVEVAHAAVEAGASAVIGSHPHLLQGVELYRGAPIAYSLGNFVFGGNWDPRDKRTALAELTLLPGKPALLRMLPGVSDRYPASPVRAELTTGDEAEATLAHLRALSRAFPATVEQLRQE
jgi:poly-gamma-glutamate capsule biosynthesis protein CapA/YwtB (metallophosphatase superfamily)